MKDTDLFQMALGLVPPWLVDHYTFGQDKKQLDLYVDFTRGGKFACNGCGREKCKAYGYG